MVPFLNLRFILKLLLSFQCYEKNSRIKDINKKVSTINFQSICIKDEKQNHIIPLTVTYTMHQVNIFGYSFFTEKSYGFLIFKLGDGARFDKTRKKGGNMKTE